MELSRAFLRLFLFVFLAGAGQYAYTQCTPANPSVAFTANEDSLICAGTTLTFSPQVNAYKPVFNWDFGDNLSNTDTSSGDTVQFTFSNNGSSVRVYHVLLLVLDSCGNLDSMGQDYYVSPKLKAGFSIPVGSYACDSLPVSFTNSTVGTGLSYSWSFGDPASGSLNTSNNTNPSHRFNVGSTLDTFTIKLVVTDTCGNSDSVSRTLIVSPIPVASFSFTDSLCSGIQSFVNTSSGAGISYFWNFGDPSSGSNNSSTQSNPSHDFDNRGTGFTSYQVKLIVSNSFGCVDSLTKTRFVRRGPDPTVDDFTSSTPFTQCSNTGTFLLTIDNSSLTSNSYYLIDWGDTSGIDSLTSFSSDTHTYVGYGLRLLKVKAVDAAGCQRTDTFRVFNGSNPSGGLASPGSTINLCAPIQLGFPLTSVGNNPSGTTYTLSVNDGSASVTYQHPPPDTIFHTFTGSSCGTTITGTQSYDNSFSVTLTITNPCGFTAASILPITLSSKPRAAIDVSKDTACIDKDLVFIDDVSFGAQYVTQASNNFTCDTIPLRRWKVDRPTTDYTLVSGYFGGTNFNNNPTPGPNGNGSPGLQVRFHDTGLFVFSLLSGFPSTNTQKCGYDSTAYLIYVVDTVNVAFTLNLNPSNGCVNNSFVPNNQSTGPIESYRWTITPSTGFSFQSGNQYSVSPTLRFTEPGAFDVNLKVFGFCNDDDTTATITIRAKPDVSLPADTAYCGAQTLNFANVLHAPTVDTNYSSVSSYKWRISGGNYSYANGTDSSDLLPQISFQDTGRYQVYFTATNACGESQADTQEVYIRPIPTTGSASLTDFSVCPLTSISISNFVSNPPGATYTWTNSNTAIGLAASGNGNIPSFTAAANTSGAPRLAEILVYAGLNGCFNVPDTIEIEIKPTPIPAAKSDIQVCPGDTIQIGAFSSTPTGAAFVWTNTNDSIGLASLGSGNISSFIAPTNNGSTAITGKIVYSPSLNGCSGPADSFTVSIRTRPNMTGLVDTVVCPDISFVYPSFNSVPSGATFTWYNSNTAVGLSDSGTGSLPSFTTLYNTTGSNVQSTIVVIPNYNVCLGFADTFTLTVKPAPVMQTLSDTVFCPGDTVVLPAFQSTPAADGFFWTNSSSANGFASSGNGNISGFNAGTNTTGSIRNSQVIVIPQLNACNGRADTFILGVKPTPQAQGLNDILVCPQDSILVPAFSSTPSGATFSWTNTNDSIGLSFSASGNITPYIAPANSGLSLLVGTIRYTPVLNQCIGDDDSFQISIKPTPSMVPVSDIEVCTWELIQIGSFSSLPSGATFSWTNSNVQNGLSTSGTGNISDYFAPANTSGSLVTGSIRVVPTLSSCVGISDTFEVRIRPQPTADAGLNDTLCFGQSAQIGQSSVSGQSYSWSSVPAGMSQNGTPVTVTPTQSTSYILSTYDSSTTCTQRDTMSILVNPIIGANTLSGDQIICAGQAPSGFTGSNPSGGISSYQYQWLISTDSSTWSSIAGANSSSYSPGTLQVNTHYRRIVYSGPCTDTSSVLRVIVLPGLGNNFISGEDTICAFFAPASIQGSSPSGGNGNYTYSWQQTNDTNQSPSTISGATGINYTPGIQSTTNYFRRVVSSGACVVPGNWVEIRVKPKPNAAYVVNNACYSFSHSFTNQSTISSGSLDSFYWNFGDSSTSTANSPAHTYSWTGAKTVKLIVASDFGCRDSLTKTVYTHPKPLAAFDSSNACHGLANSFTNQSTLSVGSIVSYAWSFGDGNSATQSSPSHIYADTGLYAVRLIVTSDSGCTDSAFHAADVYSKPVAGWIGEDVCFNQITHFTDTSKVDEGTLVSWLWDFGNGDTSSTIHPVKTYSTADTFDVRLIVTSDHGCKDTSDNPVIVYPSISNNNIAGADTICSGSQITGINGTGPQGGTGTYTYQWQRSNNNSTWTSISGANSQNLGALTLFSDTWFRRIVTSSPCDSNEQSISNTVFILVTPGISNNNISGNDSICAFFTPAIIQGSTPSGGNSSYTFSWESVSDTSGTPSIISGATGIDFTSGALTTTTYFRRIVSSGSCDTRSNWVEIRVKPKPNAAYVVNNACYTFSHSFTNQSTISSGSLDSFYWNFGDTSTSTANSPAHTYSWTGAKSVKLIVASDFGCRDSLTKTVHTHPKPLAAFDSSNACYGLANAFTNQSTLSVGSIVNNAWSFGDGNSATQSSPSHIYTDTGLYAVRLIVTSDSGCTDSVFHAADVYSKPVAGWIGEDVCFNQITHFTDTSKVDEGTLVSWLWDFGNGDTSSTIHPVKIYSTADTFDVRLIVTSDQGCKDTSDKPVIVYPSISNNTISGEDTICAGSSITGISGSSPQGGTGTFVYEWQQSTDTINWTVLASSQNLGTQSPTTTIWYRRIVISSPCDSNERSISNWVRIVVTPGIGNNSISPDQVICYGQSADSIFGSTPTGGNGNYTYQWQQSSDAINWSGISGATQIHFQSPVLTDSIYYRRVVFSQACDVSSNPVKIAVKPLPVPGFASANICFPEPVTFTDTSSVNQGAIVYSSFYFGDGDSSLNSPVSHGYANAGTYQVSQYLRSNFGCEDSLQKSLIIYPKPQASISQQNVCFPFAMDFTDSSTIASGTLSAWLWRFGDGDSSQVQHPSKTYTVDSSYTVTLIVESNFACRDTASQLVWVHPKPNPFWGATEICFPNTTNFYDSTTLKNGSLQSWSWDFGDGNTTTQQHPSHTYATAGSYTVKMITESDSNCIDSFSQLVEVRPLPIMNFTLDTLGCLNAPNVLNNQTTLSQSQVWTFGNGVSDTAFAPQPAYSGIGRYQIKLVSTTAYGCIDSTDRFIRIIAPPVASIDLSLDSGCGPLPVDFTNSSVNEFPGWFWDLGNGNSYIDTFPPTEVYAPSLFSDTTYFIRLWATNKCGIDSALDSVRVLPVPTAVFGQNVNQGCSPLHLDLLNNSYGRPHGYSWYYGDGDSSNNGLGIHQHTFITGNRDTTFAIRLVARNQCGVDTAYSSIFIKPNTVTAFFNSDTNQGCEPLLVQFSDFSVGGSYLYYDFGDGNTSLSINPSHTFNGPGIYTVRQFVDNGCSYDTVSQQIEVLPNVVPQFNITSSPECIGAPVTFTNQTAGVGALRWYFGDGDSSDLTTVNHAFGSSGTFNVTLRVISAANGCPASLSKPVNIMPLPGTQFSLPLDQGCPPFTPTFVNTTGNGQFYAWDFGDGNTGSGNAPSHAFTQTGVYTVKLISQSAQGCIDSATQTVRVHPVPQAGFTYSLATECDTPAQTQFFNSSTGATSYTWDFGDGANSALNNPAHAYYQFGTWTIRLRAENSFGCWDTSSSSITIYPVPQAAFTFAPDSGCMPLEVQFTNTSQNTQSWQWDFGDGNGSSLQDPIHTYLTDGLFSVRLIAYGGGTCSDTLDQTDIIRVFPKPVSLFSFTQITNDPVAMGRVRFTNQSQQANLYQWDFGDGTESQELNPEIRYRYHGSYVVSLAVANSFGCLDTSEQIIDLEFFKGLYVPNAFTPEYGQPDVRVFKPSGTSLKTYRLRIFDTWGNLLWESSALTNGEPAEGWDGRVDGQLLQQDVYVWKVEAEFLDGTQWAGMKGADGKYRKEGTLTLIR